MTYVPTGWKDIWNLLQSFVCACCNTTRTVTTTATVRALKTVTRLRMRNGRIFKCCQFLCITKSMFKNVAPSTSTGLRMREGLSFGLNFKYMCKFHRCNQGLRRVVVCGIDSKTRTVRGENRTGPGVQDLENVTLLHRWLLILFKRGPPRCPSDQQSTEPEDYYPHGSDENTLLFQLMSFAGNDRAGPAHKVTCISVTWHPCWETTSTPRHQRRHCTFVKCILSTLSNSNCSYYFTSTTSTTTTSRSTSTSTRPLPHLKFYKSLKRTIINATLHQSEWRSEWRSEKGLISSCELRSAVYLM